MNIIIFEKFNSFKKIYSYGNPSEIESICKKYRIKNYTIDPDGSIDVDGDVDLCEKRLTKIPLIMIGKEPVKKINGYKCI